MMKKILAAFLAATMILAGFVGCTKREADKPSEAASQAEESSAPGPSGATPPESATEEQAAENNRDIPKSAVDLVQFQEPKTGDKLAVMKTSMGTVTIRLFAEQAPKTVENFLGLVEKNYYNGVAFHQVLRDLSIGAGDPDGDGGQSFFSTGTGDKGYFDDEFSLNLWHFRGAVSMANTGKNTNTSAFFIVQKDFVDDKTLEDMQKIQTPPDVIDAYTEVGGLPHLDWHNTVFGMVTEGMEVVDEIAAVKLGEDGLPETPVLIESITVKEVE